MLTDKDHYWDKFRERLAQEDSVATENNRASFIPLKENLAMGTIQHFDKVYKVVNESKNSALLNVSSAIVNYNSGRNFVPPTLDGTPIMLFTDVASAFEFADKFDGKVVYEAEAYGEAVVVDRVLKIKNPGWERNAVAFWQAVLAKTSLDRFDTIEAKDNSIALFGVVRLHGRATRPAPKAVAVAPAASPAPRQWRGW